MKEFEVKFIKNGKEIDCFVIDVGKAHIAAAGTNNTNNQSFKL